MWPFSGAARNELAQSHTAVSKVVVLRAGRPTYTLTAVDGTITADADRSTMWNFGGTVVDPTGALSGSDADDLLNPYDCEVAVYRGVQLPGGSGLTEVAPLGVYKLTGRAVSGDGSIDLSGQDRSIIYQGPMTAPIAISAGTSLEEAVRQLLTTRHSGLKLRTLITGNTVGPLLYAADIDVWKEAQSLAQAAGARLFHDRTGLCTLAPALPNSLRPVKRFAEGDGLLLEVKRQEDSDSIHNVVTVQKDAGSPIRATVQDTDPTSPTYAGGKYGKRPITITNSNINDITQATLAARNELVRQLGRSETVTLSVVPDPCLDPWDPIIVNRPTADLANRSLIVSGLTVPLAVDAAMSVACRKFVLTKNGAQVDLPIEVTTA